jgi:hypothetical protein
MSGKKFSTAGKLGQGLPDGAHIFKPKIYIGEYFGET